MNHVIKVSSIQPLLSDYNLFNWLSVKDNS